MTVTIIKHIDIEGPGTFGDFLNDDGISYDVIDVFNGEPLPGSLSDTSAVIVLGGPMNVYEEDKHPFLKQENEFLKEVIDFLICLNITSLSAGRFIKVISWLSL